MFFKSKFSASSYDFMIVGLGNPGKEYEGTRHNAGFIAADAIISSLGGSGEKLKSKALICECKADNKRILVVKPQTYMNLSGQAVRDVAKFYKIPNDKIIVIFDDISLDVGKIRIRRNGSHGGHNGMKNISECMSTNDIMRIKIGVGKKPHPEYDLKDWVLSRFKNDEKASLEAATEKTVLAVREIINFGIDRAMNKYNS
ncbi:MAG: aminoacyl-tRNA hydrolase [Clostridia bacterium]|nr:aminoacyl-tRNA hydrolase [Clostridia bacterium]